MLRYNKQFLEIWPKNNGAVKLRENDVMQLRALAKIQKPERITTVKDVMEKSRQFPLEFPINTCRIMSQSNQRHPQIQQQIESAYPVIHERVLFLYMAYLENKKRHGNAIEQQMYANMNVTAFIDRLLLKRCACFFGENDSYLLVTGERGIGDLVQQDPVKLQQVLSCDENKLSALLSVSSHSEFLNKGDRNNCGRLETDATKFEPEGVIIGIIGPFLKRPRRMDYQDAVVAARQNTEANGYGAEPSPYRRLWRDFYEEPDFLAADVAKSPPDNERFAAVTFDGEKIDAVVLKKRYTITFDTLLLESEARAAKAGRPAYVHVVGVGLGVWRVTQSQTDIFLATFGQRLAALVDKLPHVGVVDFSWFHVSESGNLRDGGLVEGRTHPDGGIRIYFSQRNPAAKLPKEHENMLVIQSYAWDGNALPGNEFWLGSLSDSGDPAAACSTLITELHNAHINGEMVSGANLHIASERYGAVLHVASYAEKVLEEPEMGDPK